MRDVDSRTSEWTSPITDSGVATEPTWDPIAGGLFRKPAFIGWEPKTSLQGSTLGRRLESFEGSTSQEPDSAELTARISEIFSSAREQVFEDGMESAFSLAFAELLTSFGHSAMEGIISLVISGQVNPEVVAESLRVIGRLRHVATHRDRLWLLERCLYSPSVRVRDGAVVGLAFLDDRLAGDPLRSAIERESVAELRDDMKRVLAQF